MISYACTHRRLIVMRRYVERLLKNDMIRTKEDLKEYIAADRKVQNMQYPFWAGLTNGENAIIRRYMTTLRKAEYHKNKKSHLNKLFYCFYFFRYRKMCVKYNLHIALNTVGKGVHIVHLGYVKLSAHTHIGNNCTLLPMVLFGRKSPDIANPNIYVGDNCYISTGVTVLGPVRIGNNVTVAAGAVVVKDIPDNAVVAGVPAEVIKYKIL